MKRAFAIGTAVMVGVLIGRIQTVENHVANDAVAAQLRVEKKLLAVRHDAARARLLLDKTERSVVVMWRRLEPMLDDLAHADSIIERDAARRRITQLRWEMDAVETRIIAARPPSEDERTQIRAAWLKPAVPR